MLQIIETKIGYSTPFSKVCLPLSCNIYIRPQIDIGKF